MSDTIRCERAVFGKLVQEPGGSIVPNTEHGVTGWSPGVGPEVRNKLNHRTLGFLGIKNLDLFQWRQYPWKEGGFVVQPFPEVSPEILVAYRVFGHEESKGSRLYNQAAFALISAEEWDYRALVPLFHALKPKPMVQGDDPDLEPLSLTLEDWGKPLPAGWLDRISPWLESIFSGNGVCVCDIERPLPELVADLALCQAAMPRVLPWRMKCGVGLVDSPELFTLGFGLSGHGSQPGSAPEYESGPAYVQWLRNGAGKVKTHGELAGVVAEAMPRYLDHDGVDAATDWARTAVIVSVLPLEEKRIGQLDAYLRGRGEMPLLDFRFLGHQAVECVVTGLLENLEAARKALPSILGVEWEEAWSRFLEESGGKDPRLRPLARLLGQKELGDPSELAELAGLNLPVDLEPQVAERLNQALSNATEGAPWARLAKRGQGQAAWLNRWQEAAEHRLCLLALGDFVSASQDGRLLQALDWSTSRQLLWDTINNNRLPSLQEFSPLVGAVDKVVIGGWGKVLDLAGHEKPMNPLVAVGLAEATAQAGFRVPLYAALSSREGWLSWSEAKREAFVSRLVTAFLENPDWMSITERLARPILYGWCDLSSGSQGELERKMADAVAEPAASLILGVHSARASKGSAVDLGMEVAADYLEEQPLLAERLIPFLRNPAEVGGGLGDPVYERALGLLMRWLPVSGKGRYSCPLTWSLAMLQERIQTGDERFFINKKRVDELQQVLTATHFQQLLRRLFPPRTISLEFFEARDYEALEWLLSSMPEQEAKSFSKAQMVMFFDQVLSNEDLYESVYSELRNTGRKRRKLPGWRKVFKPQKLNELEEDALRQKPIRAKHVALALERDWKLPLEVIIRINLEEMENRRWTLYDHYPMFQQIMNAARNLEKDQLYNNVVLAALKSLTPGDFNLVRKNVNRGFSFKLLPSSVKRVLKMLNGVGTDRMRNNLLTKAREHKMDNVLFL